MRTASPASCAPRARLKESSHWRMMARASSTSTPPAAVSLTPACERSKTRTPYSASNPETCFTSAGVETESLAAAREKLPSSAAATTASRRLSYIYAPTRNAAFPWYKPAVNTILTNALFTCSNAAHRMLLVNFTKNAR